jgi:hypothetical protein
MSDARDPQFLALRALVKVLFDALVEHYESEIGIHQELQSRAERLIESYVFDLPAPRANVLRKQALEELSLMLSDGSMPPAEDEETSTAHD